jgi:hypothetical protein
MMGTGYQDADYWRRFYAQGGQPPAQETPTPGLNPQAFQRPTQTAKMGRGMYQMGGAPMAAPQAPPTPMSGQGYQNADYWRQFYAQPRYGTGSKGLR